MGLPAKLVCAVTCNDIVSRAVSSGDFSKSSHVTATLAPAMDIQVYTTYVLLVNVLLCSPSNFEALFTI